MDVTIAAGTVASPAIALEANQVSTVTFEGRVRRVEIVSNGAADIRWTCDGTDPGESDGYFIPAMSAVDSRTPEMLEAEGDATVIKLWSPGSPTVVVQHGDLGPR